MVNEQIIDISGPLKGEIEVPGDKSMTPCNHVGVAS